MKTQAIRPCDACGKPHGVIVYDINVRVSIISGNARERLQGPVSETADLQLCPNCMCGLNSHALPLAMDHRARQLDQQPKLPSHCQVYHWPHHPAKGTATMNAPQDFSAVLEQLPISCIRPSPFKAQTLRRQHFSSVKLIELAASIAASSLSASSVSSIT